MLTSRGSFLKKALKTNEKSTFFLFSGVEVGTKIEQTSIGKSRPRRDVSFCDPKTPQEATKTPQDAPKTPQDAPKTRPRRPKTPPRRAQDAPGRPKRCPGGPQDAPKSIQIPYLCWIARKSKKTLKNKGKSMIFKVAGLIFRSQNRWFFGSVLMEYTQDVPRRSQDVPRRP